MRYKYPFFAVQFLFFLITLLFTVSASAQNQNNIWYFGANAGVDFNQNPAVALTNGKLNASEACASVADEAGSLLFYTDGLTVWNKNHNVMDNGTGLAGDINKSATQILVIPQPNDDQQYLIFTMSGFGGELYYSIVNMTHNGGLGRVTQKNTYLLDASTEKITAVRHANGTDIWVIGHESNTNIFYEWLVKATGLLQVPERTIPIGRLQSGRATSSIGYLKVSPNATMIVSAANDANGGFVEQFDFNNATGAITNPQILTGFTNGTIPYGIEFSPNSNLLYISEYQSNLAGNIYQVKLPFVTGTINNKGAVLNSLQGVATLQIAPNGRIYVSQVDKGFLHAINSPNSEGGESDFQLNALPLGSRKTKLGLPSFNINNFTGLSYNSVGNCSAQPTQFKITSNNTNFDIITWDFGDPASGAANTSNQRDPLHQFTADGVYTVTVTTIRNGISDSKARQITILKSPDGALHDVVADKPILCADGTVNITAQGATGTEVYNWYDENQALITQNNGTFQSPVLTTNTSYYVSISNGICEGERQKIDITRDNAIAEITATNTIIDLGETITLTANDAIKYEWSPAIYLDATDTRSVISKPVDNVTYTLTTTNANGCTAQATVNVIVRSDIKVPNTFTPNADGINDFWVVKNLDVLENLTQVFNRYGTLVFSARDYKNNWNGTKGGKPLPAGVYYYIIKLDNNNIKKGSLTIVR